MHDPTHSAPPWLPKASDPADEPVTRRALTGETPAPRDPASPRDPRDPRDPSPLDPATGLPVEGHSAQDQPGQEAPTSGESPAVQKFRSCRWRKTTTPEHCGHPEVLPFAGTNGFTAESWCPDCQFYKLRRILPRREY
jgi:hypothetical protein